jgi:hypothetical protein
LNWTFQLTKLNASKWTHWATIWTHGPPDV